jgi:hypothetical protein
MHCEECELEMVLRIASKDAPYAYTLSGLKDIFLSGIEVYRCPKCGGEAPCIPRIADLHRVIAHDLLKKSLRLRGDQVRYLRKFAGFPANEFAALLEINPSHLSRVETSKRNAFGKATDKLVRVIVMTATQEQYHKNVLMELAKGRIANRTAVKSGSKPAQKPLFVLVSNRWKVA